MGLALVGLCLLLTLAALVDLGLSAPRARAGLDALLPEDHRVTDPRPMAILRVDHGALSEDSEGPEHDPRTVLAEAGFVLEEALGEERVPHAPPKTEITRWLDAHALYLLPLDAHRALAERLSDTAMLAEVQGLQARMASPLFSVSGEQPRRDPLAIAELSAGAAGRLGHVAEAPGSGGPQVGPNGDLLSASGDRALVQLVSTRAPEVLRGELEAALEGLPVTVELVSPATREQAAAARLGEDARETVLACLAALVLLFAVVVRRPAPVLATLACLVSVGAVLRWVVGELDLVGLPLLVALFGFGCDASVRAWAKRSHSALPTWTATALFAAALLPLYFGPYPAWQRWALIWAVAYPSLALIAWLVAPTVLGLARGQLDARAGLRPRRIPLLGPALCLLALGGGAWAAEALDYRAPGSLPLSADARDVGERELVEHFFDPAMIVEARSLAPADHDAPSEAAAALDAAADDFARLASLVPEVAQRIDSPGAFVLPREELEARKAALAKLDLETRMDSLRALLVDQGLRAEAFSEFIRGAADIDELPSAQAALDGPLGPWISAYLLAPDTETGTDTEARIALRTRVELRGREGLPAVDLDEQTLASLPAMRGPAIAAMIDHQRFEERMIAFSLAGLWLSAFLIWLATRRLGLAIHAAVIAAACEAGVLATLRLLELPVGPHLLPALLLVGAAGALSGAQVGAAARGAPPLQGRALLLGLGGQLLAGAALFVSGQPLWRELGVALAVGAALAAALGLLAGPSFTKPAPDKNPKAKAKPAPDQKPEPEPEPDPDPDPDPDPTQTRARGGAKP
ncbi:hypothetical protein G6O69_11825 [Pseudenhygromyxa sp. WMMC2535]|uniref:hypothetical protein n=1 Tax=Pseudenhygromyxa sp. WMMC2535 TaxID=2712867 RepID=UPI00155524AE|nr:hypothetical protein [Pseudenhygromyxa sp. WMMC2535]NVB38520.1 hypothetical protein [Pseudenhygromyxa sp. WMMC2535]